MRKTIQHPGLIHNEPTDVLISDCSEMNNPHDRQQDYGISTTMGERLENYLGVMKDQERAFGV